MRVRFCWGIVAVIVGLTGWVSSASALASVPVDFCQYYPCQDEDAYVVFPLPPTVTALPCDADGHAPALAPDETDDLQTWIDLVPDGVGSRGVAGSTVTEWHVLLFPAGLCIRLDGQLKVEERNYLIFEGGAPAGSPVADVTLDQHLKPAVSGTIGGEWGPGIVGWNVWRGSHLKWNSFKIIGNHPDKIYRATYGWTKVSTRAVCHDDPAPQGNCEWQYGWALRGTQHVTLEGNETRNTNGESVFIAWDEPNYTIDSRFITITNHKVYGSGRQGIAGMSGQDILISNSYIEGAHFNATLFEPESTDNAFPVRRATITGNVFGQSGEAAIFALTGHCTDVTDIAFTHNTQIEPNISWVPPVWLDAPPAPCTREHSRLSITDNNLLVQGDDPYEIAGFSRRWSDVTWDSNSIKRDCYWCPSSAAIGLDIWGGTGHGVYNNDLAVSGTGLHPWESVYRYDGVVHGSLGTNVNACGNSTVQGADQPQACP